MKVYLCFDIELETNEHEYECIFMKSQHAAGHGTGVDMYLIIRCMYRDERAMKIKPLSSFPDIYIASYGDHYLNSKACSARPCSLPAGKSCPIPPARMLAITYMHLLLSHRSRHVFHSTHPINVQHHRITRLTRQTVALVVQPRHSCLAIWDRQRDAWSRFGFGYR